MCELKSDFVLLFPVIKNRIECAQYKQFAPGIFPDFETYRYPLYYSQIWVPPNHRAELFPFANLTGTKITFDFGRHLINHPSLSNGVRSIRVIKKESDADFKTNCCRGINDQEECGAYAKTSGEDSGICDSIMTQHCIKHPEDELCSCLLSNDAEIPAICSNPNCISKGYKFSTMKNYKCPDLQISNKTVSISGQGNVIGSIDGAPASTPATEPEDPEAKKYQIVLIFLIFLILVIAIIGIASPIIVGGSVITVGGVITRGGI